MIRGQEHTRNEQSQKVGGQKASHKTFPQKVAKRKPVEFGGGESEQRVREEKTGEEEERVRSPRGATQQERAEKRQ